MLEEVPRFWQLIQDRRAPPLDPLRDLYRPQGGQARQWEHLTRALRHRHAFLQFLKTQIAEHEAACAQLERELLMLMGEFQQGEHDGLAVAVSLKRGSVDYRAVCEAKLSLTAAELDDYRRASQRQVTVTDRDTLKPRAKPRRSVEADILSEGVPAGVDPRGEPLVRGGLEERRAGVPARFIRRIEAVDQS